MSKKSNGVSISLSRGPFQNNGASPWYAEVGVGTSPQKLKLPFDTGSDFIWVTSSLCSKSGCVHYGGSRFEINDSSTFQWVDKTIKVESYGPWGSMNVETGNDIFTLTPTHDEGIVTIQTDTYLAQSYSGTQFAELNWDGGIGIPSQVNNAATLNSNAPYVSYRGMSPRSSQQPPSFNFIQNLVQKGVIQSDMPFVGFQSNAEDKEGLVEFGRLNQEYKDSKEYLFFPWEAYAIPSVDYIWTTPITSLHLGKVDLLKENTSGVTNSFCLDTGASQFKGDPSIMTKAFELATRYGQDLVIEAGQSDSGGVGRMVVPASLYNVEIEAGSDKGRTIAQFDKLDGLNGLVLAGSVMIDHLYTVYEYSIDTSGPEPEIKPVGMWVFNKKDGHKIITTVQKDTARIFQSF